MHTMQSDGISHGFIVLYAMGFHTLGVMLNQVAYFDFVVMAH